MSIKNNSWIPENIFIKCLYSAHHTVGIDWCYSDDKTDYDNLVLICSGRGIFTCNGEERAVEHGDLAYFPSGASRTMRAKGEELMFRSFNFRYKLLFEHKLEWWLENPALPLDFITKLSDRALLHRIEQLFEQIQRCYTMLQYASSFKMRFYATEILSLLLSERQYNISYSERNIVNKSIEYMSGHFTEKITLDELAAISQRSVSHYGKIFKKVMGITPIDYLLSVRIAYAKKLLENGSSITETASLCGFSNLYYFSKAFRAREDMPPSEYRSLYSGEHN